MEPTDYTTPAIDLVTTPAMPSKVPSHNPKIPFFYAPSIGFFTIPVIPPNSEIDNALLAFFVPSVSPNGLFSI
jgi:hypothetical protein